MSSYRTTITIPDAEWEAIQTCISDTSRYVARRKELIDAIQREAEQRQKEIEAARELSRQTVQRAVEDLVSFHADALDRISGQGGSAIEQQSGQFKESIQGLREAVENNRVRLSYATEQINSIAEQYQAVFSTLENRQRGTAERASLVSKELDRLLERIKPLNPLILAPNDYAALDSMATSARANLSVGDYGAALTVSQNGVLSAASLLTRLVVLNDQYRSRLSALQMRALTLHNRFETFTADGSVDAEFNGQEFEYDYDISHWSYGRFDQLREQFQAIQHTISSGRLSMKELAVIEDNLTILSEQLDACDIMARREMIASEHVFQTAQLLDRCLSGVWRRERGEFQDGDDRGPFVLQYSDNSANHISLIVSPSSDGERPRFMLETFNDEEDVVMASAIKDGLHSTLAANGAIIEEQERRDDCHAHCDQQSFTDASIREALHTRQLRLGQ